MLMKRKDIPEVRKKIVPVRMAPSEETLINKLVDHYNKTPKFRWVPATKADVFRDALKLLERNVLKSNKKTAIKTT